MSIHKKTDIVAHFDNGANLDPKYYIEQRDLILHFLTIDKEFLSSLETEDKELIENHFKCVFFSGHYRELVRNKKEYYKLIGHFVELFGKPLENDLTLYRSMGVWHHKETKEELGCFWTSDINTALRYNAISSDSHILAKITLKKGTVIYHIDRDTLPDMRVKEVHKNDGDEYWVDMRKMVGYSEIAKRNRAENGLRITYNGVDVTNMDIRYGNAA